MTHVRLISKQSVPSVGQIDVPDIILPAWVLSIIRNATATGAKKDPEVRADGDPEDV